MVEFLEELGWLNQEVILQELPVKGEQCPPVGSLLRVNLELICEVWSKGGGQDIPCCLVCSGHMKVVEEDIGLGHLFGLLVLVVPVWVPCDLGEEHFVGCNVVSKYGLELEDGLASECWVGHFDDDWAVVEEGCGFWQFRVHLVPHVVVGVGLWGLFGWFEEVVEKVCRMRDLWWLIGCLAMLVVLMGGSTSATRIA